MNLRLSLALLDPPEVTTPETVASDHRAAVDEARQKAKELQQWAS